MVAEGGLDRGEALFDSLGHGCGKFCGDSNMQQIGCQCVVLVNRRVWTGSLQHVPGSKWGQGLRRRVRTAQGRVIAAPAGSMAGATSVHEPGGVQQASPHQD